MRLPEELFDTDSSEELRRKIHKALFAGANSVRGLAPHENVLWQSAMFALDHIATNFDLAATGKFTTRLNREAKSDLERLLTERFTVSADELLQWLCENPDFRFQFGSELFRAAESGYRMESVSSRAAEQVVQAVTLGLGLDRRPNLRVLDSMCGYGSLLSAVSRVAPNLDHISGQDINVGAIGVAERNLAITGQHLQASTANLLVEDGFPQEDFDLVLLDAPLSLSWQHIQIGDEEQRFQLGHPPRNDAAWLFIQASLAKLRQGPDRPGVLIAFTSRTPIAAHLPPLDAIRSRILQLDLLQAVIALPEGVRPGSGIPMYALVFNATKSDAWQGKTQIVDLRGQHEPIFSDARERRFTRAALEELSDAMARPKPSGMVRTRTSRQFVYTRYDLHAHDVLSLSDQGRISEVSVPLVLPEDADPTSWPPNPKGIGTPIELTCKVTDLVSFAPEVAFPSGTVQTHAMQGLALQWPHAPLLALASSIRYSRSERARKDVHVPPEFDDAPALVIPLTLRGEVSYGTVDDILPKTRCLLVRLRPEIDGEFLAHWLNSSAGRLALDAAAAELGWSTAGLAPRTLSISDPARLLAHLQVPVPDATEQSQITQVQDELLSGMRRLEELRNEVWRDPSAKSKVKLITRQWVESEDLLHWTESLPYPLAASLRTLATLTNDEEKSARQLVHFWEATATFLSAYLLGALKTSDMLWRTEIPALKSALANGNCSFERATLGTWKITIERLSKVFRAALASDNPDDVEQARWMLGGAPPELINRILSVEISKLLSKVINARNTMDGHGATMSRPQAHEVFLEFKSFTEQLRDLLGYGWSEFPLIRAGSIEYLDDGPYVTAEVLMGPTTPFGIKVLAAPQQPLKKNVIYLLGDAGSVELAPLVQLGTAPSDPETTCYFYNRLEDDRVRLVAYHLSAQNEVNRPDERVSKMLSDIARTTLPEAPIDLSDTAG